MTPIEQAIEAGFDAGDSWATNRDEIRRILAASVPVLLAALQQRIEAQRKPMPDTNSNAALAGWIMRDQALLDSAALVAEFASGVAQ
jgi:hypothetical protein